MTRAHKNCPKCKIELGEVYWEGEDLPMLYFCLKCDSFFIGEDLKDGEKEWETRGKKGNKKE